MNMDKICKNISQKQDYLIIIVSILCTWALSNQWASQNNENTVKKLQFQGTSGINYLSIYDIKYDSQTQDFIYFTETYTRGTTPYLISRRNKQGDEVWTQQFQNNLVKNSSMYSQTNGIVYSWLSSSTFTLIRLNSTNGNSLQHLMGGSAYQRYYHTCSLSSDESTIFWNGQVSSSDNGLVIIKFNTSGSAIQTVTYPSYTSPLSSNILIINNNQIFFNTYNSGQYHYIKATF